MLFWRGMAMAASLAGSVWAANCLGPANLGISAMAIALALQAASLVDLNLSSHLIRRHRSIAGELEKAAYVATIWHARLRLSLLFLPLMAGGIWVAMRWLPAGWDLALWAAVPLFLLNANTLGWVLAAQERQDRQIAELSLRAFGAAVLYLLLLRPGASAGVDVVLQVVATSLSVWLIYRSAWPRGAVPVPGMWVFLWEEIRAARWIVFNGLLLAVRARLDVLFVGAVCSVQDAGLYRSAAMLTLGVGNFLMLVPQLFYPRFIAWAEHGEAYLHLRQRRLLAVLFVGALFLVVLVVATSPWVYRWFYDARFSAAWPVLALLASARICAMVTNMIGLALVARGGEKTVFLNTLATTVVYVVVFGVGLPRFGFTAAGLAALAAEVVGLAAISARAWRMGMAGFGSAPRPPRRTEAGG